MALDLQTLEKLEKLSHLRIDASKREEVLAQLSEILDYVENLNELDTEGLDSYFSTLEGGTPMREDLPANDPDVPRIILDHAPESRDDYFIVPAIID
ncbi:Asp-tRNA(Asn)/Glu-tRNA(Gln) amidotransferase subunit GatC [Nitratifractor salsuginis]|uniref:Aspartyl/glutamyl-tRNA(Asn/Gln) amidotransferase subunit C n=1 Tax=Nitratifractor salsuginis (strain DSM 16511 / JCM 12458 / E9I37-1) TaxID=749222 RepID=E6X0W7_NITSE|nr:Asp-tRNA(Asn)/Glu-tRNA(Gln) amidotransferase subunit GatC [Nitratifractor salsuginis]ADV46899.1 aspartyl/glutamyl-tRNA(Asn/Gln) amidotransferase subunit C [Nitratifractor salsuginis DSM 16511]